MKDFLFFDAPLGRTGHSFMLLLLRLFIGGMMLLHGWSKLAGFAGLSSVFPDPLGVGSPLSLMLSILAEVGCSLLVIGGVFTRLALLPLIFNMVVAITLVHGADPFQVKEIGVMYLAVYVYLFITGAGRYSLDYAFFRRRLTRHRGWVL